MTKVALSSGDRNPESKKWKEMILKAASRMKELLILGYPNGEWKRVAMDGIVVNQWTSVPTKPHEGD